MKVNSPFLLCATVASIGVFGSLAMLRTPFWILMGIGLLVAVWRIARGSPAWSGRVLLAGAVMLALGYALLLPLHHSALAVPAASCGGNEHAHDCDAEQLAATLTLARQVTMNSGWLLLGLGLFLHGRSPNRAKAATTPSPTLLAHESIA